VALRGPVARLQALAALRAWVALLREPVARLQAWVALLREPVARLQACRWQPLTPVSANKLSRRPELISLR